MAKIFILVGHPDSDSECARLATAYELGARAAEHEVRMTRLGDLKFDPILHKGYKEIQALEPDLLKAQEDIKWCEHFVVLYPVWWAGMPSLLKGFFDRVWLPGFAYHFKKEGFLKGVIWHGALKGRSARIIVTMDNIPFIARLLFGDITNEMHFGILKFAGFSPVRVKKIGLMKFKTAEGKTKHAQMLERWGREGK
ncbi:MAG: NAD(P)H-dependent oxidoreductase [Candidatus Pacebacteria bacterium]|nr:NAD(P)H-dependent oxidoreductase [Candidatus Paceibacterota bacterium]MDD5357191.1 NAD(P)H-dependent oxidoreductase [Candidatus Paceibacterota bacterium]